MSRLSSVLHSEFGDAGPELYRVLLSGSDELFSKASGFGLFTVCVVSSSSQALRC